jgi:hypothetical protein
MKKLGGSGLMVHKHAAALALVLLLGSPAFGKRKDDVVIMKNGVKFTGEIKAFQYGVLIFKSDYMKDSVHLDWRQVETQSKDTFIVGLSNGQPLVAMAMTSKLSPRAQPSKRHQPT